MYDVEGRCWIASFSGLFRLQFSQLSACKIEGRKSDESYLVIHSTADVTGSRQRNLFTCTSAAIVLGAEETRPVQVEKKSHLKTIHRLGVQVLKSGCDMSIATPTASSFANML